MPLLKTVEDIFVRTTRAFSASLGEILRIQDRVMVLFYFSVFFLNR